MANGLQLNSSTVACGLQTQTFTVPTTGFYTVSVNCFIPYVPPGSSANSAAAAASGLQVLVKLNTSTKLTLSSPSAQQPTMSGSVIISATAGDTITIVPSSSAAADQDLNAIKYIINIDQGLN